MTLKTVFTLLLFASLIQCDVIETSRIPDYPITIDPLPLLTLDDLNREYHQLNNGTLCSTLNEFGYTGFSRILFPNDINPCADRVPDKIELANPEPLIRLAKQSILFNAKFTNVTDSSSLQIKELVPLYGCTICEGPETNSVPLEWKIIFQNQSYQSISVSESEIIVFVDSKGVNRIWGNWYEEIYAPGLLDVGYIEARETVIGEEVSLVELTEQDSVLFITNEMVGQPDNFEIVPYKNKNNQLELRKAWIVPISYKNQHYAGINAYVDAVDGVLLNYKAIVSEE
ncbi:MAG: hypothetical protein JJ895_01160 [Balneolaceae bacterium]|nr:hypothetical protein [Balneolaceae bacterium]